MSMKLGNNIEYIDNIIKMSIYRDNYFILFNSDHKFYAFASQL